MTTPVLDRVTARAYRVPTPAPEADGTLAWDATTIVVVQAEAAGVTGVGWTYADAACVPLIEGTMAPMLCGRPVLHVPALWSAVQHGTRNLGRPGLVSCALSAVDIALWDTAARLLGVPASTLLGRVHDKVAVYGSGGFTTQSAEELTEQLGGWVHTRHIPRVKIKIGESWGAQVGRDLARVRTAREVIGAGAELYVDANGAYTVGQARRVAQAFAEYDVEWFEEPVSSDDLTGLATVRAATDIDVTAGEYGYDLPYFARMVTAGAVDCLQVDVTRCGGFTEWRRIAAVAAAANLQVSAHCAQNAAAHAAVTTPNMRHLEWFADHDRIETAFFDGTLDPHGGSVTPDPSSPGLGLDLKMPDIEEYAINA
ncbi:enolase C-terminal domain-like protein [Actinophytocola sp. KF-1]